MYMRSDALCFVCSSSWSEAQESDGTSASAIWLPDESFSAPQKDNIPHIYMWISPQLFAVAIRLS